MIIFNSIETIFQLINSGSFNRKTVGFVPTMGALHEGHLSLIKRAKKECGIVVASIYVNPKQFNISDDFVNYPRKEMDDIQMLENAQVDFLFIPTEKEIALISSQNIRIDFKGLNNVMEGKFRPGHFEGVVDIVARLFSIIQPDNAYFGEKDFQQLAIIKEMNNQLNFSIKIVGVPIERNGNGLALSSRNLRLTKENIEDAQIIYLTLSNGKIWKKRNSPKATKEKMLDFFQNGNLKLEYLEIVNPLTLESLEDEWMPGARACIAAYVGDIRLIDNIELIPYS